MIHKRHHIGRVAITDDLHLREAGLNLLQVGGGKLYVKCAHVLLEKAHSLRARDGDEVMALGKNPGEGQLCGGRAFLAGELFTAWASLRFAGNAFSPKRGFVRRQSRASRSSSFWITPVKKPRPSGL